MLYSIILIVQLHVEHYICIWAVTFIAYTSISIICFHKLACSKLVNN